MRTNAIRKVYRLQNLELKCCVERLFCVNRVNDCKHLSFIWCFIRCTLYFEIRLLWNRSNSYVRNLNVARVEGSNKRVLTAYECIVMSVA